MDNGEREREGGKELAYTLFWNSCHPSRGTSACSRSGTMMHGL